MDFTEAMRKHSQWLLGKTNHVFDLMSRFIEITGAQGVSEAAKSLQSAEAGIVRAHLANAFRYSRQSHGAIAYGYIVEPEALDILLAMLRCPRSEHATLFEAELRELGVRLLGEWCFQEDIERYSRVILSRLGPPPYDERNVRENEQAWRLYGRLRLDEEAKRELAANPQAPLIVRARAGCEESEENRISSFVKAPRGDIMMSLAGDLGYIGTRRCAEALVMALKSDLNYSDIVGNVSVRVPVLKALGLIYQHEPLFTLYPSLMAGVDERQTGFSLDEYIEAVDEWVQREFGHPGWDGEAVWFVREGGFPPRKLRDPVLIEALRRRQLEREQEAQE